MRLIRWALSRVVALVHFNGRLSRRPPAPGSRASADDVNPCSRTAPCKTFAGAISKTATGGEINCLDPAGFGAVNITKSITIDGGGTIGSILSRSTSTASSSIARAAP